MLSTLPYVIPSYIGQRATLMVLSCAAIFMATCCLLITLKILCTSLYFCKIFNRDIKFRHEVEMRDHWLLRKLVPFILGRKGSVVVANSSLENRIHNEKSKFVSFSSKLKPLK